MKIRYGAPVAGNEREVLSGYLDHYRSMMLAICEGLSEDQLRRPMVASGTSLLGMIKHLAYVELGWFQENILGEPVKYPFDPDADPEADMHATAEETSAEIFDLYWSACERSREILSSVSLDDIAKREERAAGYNVRWIVLHMIEETARHAGHADILRELIDGKTGTGYE